MPKIIKKQIIFCVLAFFILGAFVSMPLNAQELRILDNGLKAIVKEDHRNPIVVFSVFLDTGSACESSYAGSGINHLIEHMLFKGTKKYPLGNIEDILNRYGGNIEGYTSYDYAGYSIVILKEHADLALDILKEMLTQPVFDTNELKKEMAVIEREMDLNRDDPSRRISRMTFSTAYVKHPYGLPVIGYKENFMRLKREEIIKFFKETYVPEKMTMAVVVDIDKLDVLNKIENVFGKLQRGQNAANSRVKEPCQVIERYVEEKADIEGAYLNISFHSTDLLDKDLYAMDLLSFILGQGESSILNEKLRMQEKIVLSISAYNYTPKDPGLFIVSAVLKEENVNKSMDRILEEIEGLKNNGVQDEELLKAKNNFLAGYIYEKETIESQANDMAQSQLLTGSPDFFKRYVENIKSVRLEDIRQVALKYLNRQNMSVAILSKSGKALSRDLEPGMQQQEENIKKITLSNNIPVIISENHSLPIVSMCILFKAGLRMENKDNNGISMLASSMLMDGTALMPRNEIAKFSESKAISINTYSRNNSLGITASCLKEQVTDMFQLASEICMNSVFPEDELKREKDELYSSIDMQDNEIVNHGHRLLKELLFKKHPYRFQLIGTHESVNKITKDSLLDFYKGAASPDNVVIGIAGDCDSKEMQALAEKYFSKINLREDLKPQPVPEKESPIEKIRENSVNINKDQSLILAGFQGIDIYDRDRYVADVLVNMLSSPSGILFKKIREEKGLTYAVGAFNVIGLDPGYIAIYGLTSKENIKDVKDRIFKQVDYLRKNMVSEEDLEKSKNFLKAMRKIDMQTNSNFIFTISMDELYGLGYNHYRDFDKNIDMVTKEDINRVANRLLTLDTCAVLTLEGK